MKQVVIVILIYFVIGSSCKQNQELQFLPTTKDQRLPFYNGPDFTAQWFENTVQDTIHTIGTFSFIDQNADTITEQTVAGKIYIADFFFTACPGICPKLTKNMKLLQDAFKDDPSVILLSHSVTPTRDDTAALKRYAVNYGIIHSKWHLLTGKKDDVYNIARKSYFADEDLGMKKDTSDFLHTENMLLIDKKRRIRGIYKGTSPAEMETIINDVKTLEKEN